MTPLSSPMNIARRGYILAGLGVIGLMSISFIRIDLAWNGSWSTHQRFGERGATVSAPWPESRVARVGKKLLIQNQSVYLTVKIPRPFESVRIRSRLWPSPTAVEFGVEPKPRSLRFITQPARRTDEIGEWIADFDLHSVDQRSHSVNVVLRFPDWNEGDDPISLDEIEFRFQRPQETWQNVIKAIWRKISA